MPSGKVHDWVTHLMVAPTVVTTYAVFERSLGESVMIAIGMWVGGIFLSPDLDIKSTPFYRWGPLRFIWWPYQWAIKHRSSASHGLFFAPFFRLVYLTAICLLFYHFGLDLMHRHGWFLDINFRHAVVHYFKQNSYNIMLLGIGVWLGSFFHVVMDFMGTNLRFKMSNR